MLTKEPTQQSSDSREQTSDIIARPTPAEMLADLDELREETPEEIIARIERLDKFETVQQARDWVAMAMQVLPANVDKDGNPGYYPMDMRYYGKQKPERAMLRERGVFKAEYTAENGTYINRVSIADALGYKYEYRNTPYETTITRTSHPHDSEMRFTEGIMLPEGPNASEKMLRVGAEDDAEKTDEELNQEFIELVKGLRVALYTVLSVDDLEKFGLGLDMRAKKATESGKKHLEIMKQETIELNKRMRRQNSISGRALSLLLRRK